VDQGAGRRRFVSWHQDATYFGLDPADQHVTAWVALTDSLPETGCVMALPGSHRLGQLPHTTHRAAANLLSNGQQAEMDVDAARAVPLAMRAGECSLHHTHLLHSSAPNRGRDRRIGVGISYIPTRGAARRSPSPHRIPRARRGPSRALRPGAAPARRLRRRGARGPRGGLRRFFGSHGSVRTEVVEA
jgi:ectoine hydroxylase-related dioxygenase (phytanoyl-CoA dioxygenase family)